MNIDFIKTDHDLVSINLFINIGKYSKNALGEYIDAHLIEHLIFNGHSTISQEELFEEIENMGGIINACVKDYSTVIFSRVPKQSVTRVLNMLCDCIVNFRIDEEMYEYENQIVTIENERFNQYSLENFMIQNIEELFEIKYNCYNDYIKLKTNYHELYDISKWQVLIIGDMIDKDISDFDYYKLSRKSVSLINQNPLKVNSIYNDKINIENDFFTYIKFTNSNDMICTKLVKNLLVSGYSSIFYKKLVQENALAYNINFYSGRIEGKNFIVIYYNGLQKSKSTFIKLLQILQSKKVFKTLVSNKDIKTALKKTITEFKLKKENISSLANDFIDGVDLDYKNHPYQTAINLLNNETEESIKKSLTKFLFGGQI